MNLKEKFILILLVSQLFLIETESRANSNTKYKPKITRLNGPRRMSNDIYRKLISINTEELKSKILGEINKQMGQLKIDPESWFLIIIRFNLKLTILSLESIQF